ncbi:MAG: hypothetical protein E7267_04445 [Lachnospiraceae bacterium]|nr:hypothetical protein [Lachnospiraceae bacterium]
MFRMWGKVFKDNHMLCDYVYSSDDYSISRTKKVFEGLEVICKEFDLSVPIWLDSNINDFKRVDKTRFNSDNFIDHIEFDFLEIHVIEE